MYITCLAGSPWAKTVSFLSNVPTFLPKPVESRNCFTSKPRLLRVARFRRRGALIETLRLTGATIGDNSMAPFRESVQNCTDCTAAHKDFARHETRRSIEDSARYKRVATLPDPRVLRS